MRFRFLAGILGIFTAAIGLTMAAPLAVSLIYRDGSAWALALSMAVSVGAGILLWLPNRGRREEINLREGMLIVSFAWIIACFSGALPFYFGGVFETFTDCLFESASGFTTTGASVLSDIESVPKGLLFWRSFTHWLGGMGIILLSIAILPLIGVGGLQLFRAEVPGPTADKIKPRIAETARTLWLVYAGLSAVEAVLLLFGGMDLFEALCHTFGTMATGGFSTKNASIGYYDSAFIHYVITLFMFLAGVNFALHFTALRGNIRAFWRDTEFRVYVSIILFFTLFQAVILSGQAGKSIFQSLRYGVFQVVSIVTTTGYSTADFEAWPKAAVVVMLLLMFVGGCTGSTGGGIKVMRLTMMFKQVYNELFLLVHPHAVKLPKYGKSVVPAEVMRSIWSFFFLYFFLLGVGTFCIGLLGYDVLTAVTSVAATIGNIGPGLGAIGPAENYAHFPMVGKWILTFCMLLGRLEIYTVIILIYPAFWKK